MYGSFDIKKTGASLCYQNFINIRNLHNNIIHKHYCTYTAHIIIRIFYLDPMKLNVLAIYKTYRVLFKFQTYSLSSSICFLLFASLI